MTLCALGIDPGLSGACVCIYPDNTVQYWDCPVIKTPKGQSNLSDHRAMGAILQQIGGGVAVLESVHVDQRDIEHLRSAETLIRNHAAWLTLLEVYGFGVVQLAPVQWRSKLGLPKGLDKKELVREAVQRFPQCRGWLKYARGTKQLTSKDGRAEALLQADLAKQLMMEVAA